MGRFKAVIFDLDGCLVDSEPLSLEAVASQMRALGVKDATADEIGQRFLGVAMPVISDYVAKRLGHPCPVDFPTRVEEALLARYPTELVRINGVETLLEALKIRGIGTAIATGGSLHRMAVTLDHSDLASFFSGTACSAEEVVQGKPAPDLFLLAADRLGFPARDCIVLEDSPHGIRGAVAAGMQAVGFVGGSHLDGLEADHTRVLKAAGASHVIARLQDFPRLIFSGAVSEAQ